ncbi:MAG: polysaccharide pyruvyl transferase family protein [Lachnospiraceae bacterium]|nr:polysaccharide pyruvyl transferase family protein [Lachnospiraceae bacterium]
MRILILGIEISSPNKGCSALGYSLITVLSRLVRNQQDCKICIAARNSNIPYDFDGRGFEISTIEIRNKDPRFYFRLGKLINKADVVFDFTEGDSFTELYGIKRFVQTSMMKQMVLNRHKPLVLGPQTYGPVYHKYAKIWMKSIIKNAEAVFSRDKMSIDFLKGVLTRDYVLTNDIAFELPYRVRNERKNDKKIIGINPSGLLWSGGYFGGNQFGLTMDYKKYICEVIEFLLRKKDIEIHLISHVILDDMENPESDNKVCDFLKTKYPNTIIAPLFDSPVQAKNYISEMDVFIGSRMHATIASFSTGVPTIPVSYSRKFEGLYDSLNYPYVISATTLDTNEAIKLTKKYLSCTEELEEAICKSRIVVDEKRKILYESLETIIRRYE